MSDDATPMTSHRPYLLRALYEWIVDNGMTPHLLVDATRPAVRVPVHAVKDGRIVLNVAERAVSHLDMGNDVIRFSARFGGVSHNVSVPVGAVLAIYARETGQGMALPEDMPAGSTEPGLGDDDGVEGDVEVEINRPSLAVVPTSNGDVDVDGDSDSDGPDDPDTPTPRRGGHLRIVK
ncbi:ClpXP protease specificity-enhancing factor [Cognatilysobacter tabacisoli]|uniref:ClpXP protease specificity-enhancing factor n=1 Tax=Cognatilysobacter tabacisoli TaxID=2315424 RepID=UPI000E6B10CD|nr:ClpXP protease specificity-enhancing factor [Lysobacter tabacisoli]